MATEVVVDSSIIVALVIPEERSLWALEKMAEYELFHLPEFAYYEVANAIKCKTPNRLSAQEAEKLFTSAIKIIDQFGVHSFGEIVVGALSLALELNIAVYDAAFLCLAETLGLRFLTLDVKLAKKLEKTRYRELIECPNKLLS
jgi:predicted nucleic acid-binding protein